LAMSKLTWGARKPWAPDCHMISIYRREDSLLSLPLGGRMVTRSPREAVRAILRKDALRLWRQRPVQGKLGSMLSLVYTRCLDLRFYTEVVIPERWTFLLLPRDQRRVDLSSMLYLCLRAIGGAGRRGSNLTQTSLPWPGLGQHLLVLPRSGPARCAGPALGRRATSS
jgi:hypothetical protein